MKAKTLLLTAALLALLAPAARAQDAPAPEKTPEPYHTPEEQRQISLEVFATKKIAFSGLLEVEAGWARTRNTGGGSTSVSDVVLSTAQIGFQTDVTSHVKGDLVLLWEEDDTEPIDIDEGKLTWSGHGFDVTAGRFYPPFGTFNSHFISDPLTLELGETQQSALQIHTAPSPHFEASLTAANGEADKAGANDTINDWTLRTDLHATTAGDGALDFGLQYTSDIADTNADVTGAIAAARGLVKKVGGLGMNLDYAGGPWILYAEYVGAARSFDPADLDADANGIGDKPRTWNFEAGYLISDTHEIAVRYEGSREFAGFPETQWGVDSSWNLGDGLFWSVEYLYGTFDTAFGTDSKRHMFTTQLSLEF